MCKQCLVAHVTDIIELAMFCPAPQPLSAHKPLDPSLREEQGSLSDELIELRSVLVRTRNEGFTCARQLREERDSLCAEVIVSCPMVTIT